MLKRQPSPVTKYHQPKPALCAAAALAICSSVSSPVCPAGFFPFARIGVIGDEGGCTSVAVATGVLTAIGYCQRMLPLPATCPVPAHDSAVDFVIVAGSAVELSAVVDFEIALSVRLILCAHAEQ